MVEVRLVPPGVITASPIASFSYLPADPTAFSDVRFDGSASTGGLGAVVTSYVWDFGDNSSGTGVIATHRYSAAGTYVAKLTVTDSNGGTNQSAGQTIVVGGGAAPTADFIVNPASPLVGQTIFFNATTSSAGTGHSLVSYDWNFGDGSTKSGSTVSKSYAAAGNYTVVLTVTDEVGQTAQTVNSVTVGASAATAAFTYSPTNPAWVRRLTSTAAIPRARARTPSCAMCGTSDAPWGPPARLRRGHPRARRCQRHLRSAFTYTVRLTVTDSKGKTATTTQDLTIAP